MNLKLSKGEVRVRLERGEAEALARGEPLAGSLTLPGGTLNWSVDPSPAPPGLDYRASELVIHVSAEAMQQILQLPPSKDLGIRADVGEVALVVEIDLWSGKKRA